MNRIDMKQNPFYEDADFALADTHYYGGIKKYQWVARQMALHGVVAKKDGTAVSAGWNGYEAIDVSGWTDIIAVDTADDYCVGLKSDGTLVFAGEHIFMRDGHSKK